MKLTAFIKDKFLLLVLHGVCMCCLSAFLYLTGTKQGNIMLVLVFWGMILTVWLVSEYIRLRNYFREAEQILEKTDQRFLLGELLPYSHRLTDRLYREMIRKSNKSVIERIRRIEDESREYREYIESWVHEIKAPITSIALICENRRKSGEAEYGLIGQENQRIENYVDLALYYARSEEVYKDYLIRKTTLQPLICEILTKNRLYLIQNQVQAEVDCKESVYTDEKWIGFIVNQILLNSVKYKKAEQERCSGKELKQCSDTEITESKQQPGLEATEAAPLKLHIYTEKTEHTIRLVIADNGIGIKPEDLGRIFEKGFTGSNGRDHERSTGMGLYLCRKLCEKLGIQIEAESEYGVGTKLILIFPVSRYIVKSE